MPAVRMNRAVKKTAVLNKFNSQRPRKTSSEKQKSVSEDQKQKFKRLSAKEWRSLSVQPQTFEGKNTNYQDRINKLLFFTAHPGIEVKLSAYYMVSLYYK